MTLATNLTDFSATGGGAAGNFTTGYYHYYPNFQEVVHHYYPTYIGTWEQKSKIEQAFKIVQKLQEKKLLTLKTVKDFIETVNDISEVL